VGVETRLVRVERSRISHGGPLFYYKRGPSENLKTSKKIYFEKEVFLKKN